MKLGQNRDEIGFEIKFKFEIGFKIGFEITQKKISNVFEQKFAEDRQLLISTDFSAVVSGNH